MEALAYTYLIGWTNLNKWYYGLRWGNVKLNISHYLIKKYCKQGIIL
jgi:hypothetical protein